MWHHALLGSGPHDPARTIEYLPQGVLSLRGIFRHQGQIRCGKCPFIITDITGVGFSFHTPSLPKVHNRLYRVKLEEHLFTASAGTSVRIPDTWRSLTTGRMFLPGGLRGFFEGLRPLYLVPQLDMPALTELGARYGLVVTGPPLTE